VAWPDGTPVIGAHICVAYENADDYESLTGKHCFKETDQNGLAVVGIYGASQVRVFAEQSGDREGQRPGDSFHSRPVQYAADRIPNSVDLVLNPVKR